MYKALRVLCRGIGAWETVVWQTQDMMKAPGTWF